MQEFDYKMHNLIFLLRLMPVPVVPRGEPGLFLEDLGEVLGRLEARAFRDQVIRLVGCFQQMLRLMDPALGQVIN